MIHCGANDFGGVPVEVVRKNRLRRINLRVLADGAVCLSVPKRWTTLREAEAFLRSKWAWVLKTRAVALSRPAASSLPLTDAELDALRELLGELNAIWAARVGEPGVAWRIRPAKTLWGSCRWRARTIVYNAELARAPRDLVEYVVVHEYTHFAAHGHGSDFRALMDARLPGWRELRRRLNRRAWETPRVPSDPAPYPFACGLRPVVQDFLPGF